MTLTPTPFAGDPTSVKGAITPLVTPFHADGALDLESVATLVNWQLDRGSHGISVGGSTGEPTSQTVAERIDVMRAATAAIAGRVPFLPGTGSARLDETLEPDAEAQALGAAAALVVTPYYGRPTSRRACSTGTRASPASSRTCRSSSTTCRSARRSTSRRRRSARLRAQARQHRRDQGDDARLRARLLRAERVRDRLHRPDRGSSCSATRCSCLGGGGHLSCVGNFAPEPVAELYDAFVAGDHARARQLHYDLHPLVDAAFAETNPIPAKWVMERMGVLPSGFAREPMSPLSDARPARRSRRCSATACTSALTPRQRHV